MQPLRPSKALLLFDQMESWTLVALVGVVTVGFALAYWSITALYPQQGLYVVVGNARIPIGFLNALYFSIVTETTLGANDIYVGSAAKFLVSIQVFTGLALGGIIVAKVTSIRGRVLRLLSYKIQGDWIDYTTMPDGTKVFTYNTVYLTDGTLRFDGENYDINGKPLGFFRSELFDSDGPILRFHYSNLASSTTHFAEGTMTLRFVETKSPYAQSGNWTRYQATAHDFIKNMTITFEGHRPTDDEVNAFHSQDRIAQLKIIKAHFTTQDT